MKATFKFGIHINCNKGLTKDKPFENMEVGEKVYIPVSQHMGAPCIPVVNKGDKVKTGTLVAKANGFVSANIYSSISGEVDGTVLREAVNGLKINHIVIKNDGLYEEEFMSPLEEDATAKEIISRIQEAGIVGMGGATFPTHVKLSPKVAIKHLIINGAECEPYITADDRLMLEKPEEIVQGIKLFQKALNAEYVYIGIEDNKANAIKTMQKYCGDDIKVVPLKTKYPQGGEKQLIYAINKVEVPKGKLPCDVGCIVDNVATAFAVYEAIVLGKPSYARYMTISGKGVKEPKNIYARSGIPFEEIIEKTGSTEYVKAISGGPMMGISMANLNAVTTKGTSSLLLLTEKEIRQTEISSCINCGGCHQVCPMNLMPMMIDSYIQANNIEGAEKYDPMSCIECGSCAYICPAKIPLVQSIRLAKKLLKERK